MKAQSLLLSVVLFALAACGSVPDKPARLGQSSLGCIEAAVEKSNIAEASDRRAHCLAAGAIARYCSIWEAYLAAVGKEIKDVFTTGDAQWADWQADRIGIACARESRDDAALARCCKHDELLRRELAD